MSSHKIALEQDVVVTQLKGNIYLVAADGSQKQLAEGDILPRDAVLITPEGASFNGGNQTFTLSPTNEQQAEDETSQAPLLAQNQDVAAGTPDEISALQQAILGGADPTQAFEAAAAGGAPAAGGGNIGGVAGASGNGGFVTIDRTGDATIAAAGFDTANQTDAGVTGDAVAGEDDSLFTSANLILSAETQVNEGGLVTFTATLDEPVFGSDLVIQLSNGAVITIPVGQSSGSVTVAAPVDSPYVDPSTITVSITGTQGGGVSQIITGPSTTTQINDTVDTTTVTLSAPGKVNEGGQITYTASVNNAPQSDLVLTLSNGSSITIKAGELSGSVTVDAPSDDVYKDGSNLTVSITGSSGGNYEQLDTSSTVTTEVADTVDTTTVTLSSATNGQTLTEGGSIVYTASVSSPVTGSPLTVTLSNGVVITIPVGANSANSDSIPVRSDDIYQQGEESLSVTIDKTSGGNYENVVTIGTITNAVVDDQDAPTLTLTGDANVVEGGKANYTLTISDAPKTDLTVKVVVGHITTDNGDVQAVTRDVVIKAGETSAKFDVATLDDVYAEPAEQFKVSVSGTEGGDYEKAPALPGAVTTTITDEDGSDPKNPLDGVTVQIEVDKSNVVEGGPLKYTVSLVDKNGNTVALPVGNEVVLNLSWSGAAANDSDTTDRPTNVTIGADGKVEFTVTTVNDTIYEGTEKLTASISSVKANTAFEAIEISGAKGSTESIITDNDSAPKVATIVGDSVVEGNANSFAVNLTNTSSTPTTLTLTLAGDTATKGADFSGTQVTVTIGAVDQVVNVNADGSFNVTVPANTGSFSVKVDTVNDTVFEASENYTLSGAGTSSTVTGTATITDNDSAPKVATIVGDSVVEGNANSFAVNLTNTSSTPTTLTLTLASGTATKGADFSGTQVTVTIGGVDQVVNV
ncbi:retention module-containing protein, partial [Aeromonas salmonicida]|uniref:retention module-containing protein n=6 Tax=Aeromonas salmonicida TaxID=645 RepID=UPI003D02FCFA